MAETRVKRSYESKPFGGDFVNLFATGETIASVTSITATGPDSALTVGAITSGGTVAAAVLSGGTPGQRYRVRYVVVSSLGYTYGDFGWLVVRDTDEDEAPL